MDIRLNSNEMRNYVKQLGNEALIQRYKDMTFDLPNGQWIIRLGLNSVEILSPYSDTVCMKTMYLPKENRYENYDILLKELKASID
jgi:hypothetical protein